MKLFICLFTLFINALWMGFYPHNAHSTTDNTSEKFLQQWDAASAQYQSVTQQIYKNSASLMPADCEAADNIDALVLTVARLKNTPILAMSCIMQRYDFLLKYLDNPDVADMAWLAYKNNAVLAGDALLNATQQSFNSYSQARITYHKAKLFFSQKKWKQTITLLQSISIDSTLNPQEAQYAYYMTAVALQHLGQHRDALKVYNVFDTSSPYYPSVLTNKAVAYLKQGWWTDSQINLTDVIKQSTKAKHYTMVDRSHLLMGFVQLQHEFYRDARQNFRDIGINSVYLTRALSGMGLAAMHQKDFVSALNIFMLLNDKTPVDSYVQQSYILIPYVHEKLGQTRLAEAKYTQASAFYQQKINKIDQVLKSPTLASDDISAVTTILKQSDDQARVKKELSLVALSTHDQLQNDMNRLVQLKKTLIKNNDTRYLNALNKLVDTFSKLIENHHKIQLLSAKSTYQAYLNQCQFALARLYDNVN